MQIRIEDERTGTDTPGFARRFRRYGHLPVPAGAGGREVRCACDRCGAHLYAAPRADGHLVGVCLICGFDSITPV